MSGFDTYGCCEVDERLIKALGLTVFRDVPHGRHLSLGIVKYAGDDMENEVEVEVEVTGMPAQFWNFAINVSRDGKEIKKYWISTGSGNFADYWNKLNPIFEAEAEGMISIDWIKED